MLLYLTFFLVIASDAVFLNGGMCLQPVSAMYLLGLGMFARLQVLRDNANKVTGTGDITGYFHFSKCYPT